jgi:hypothetical protein
MRFPDAHPAADQEGCASVHASLVGSGVGGSREQARLRISEALGWSGERGRILVGLSISTEALRDLIAKERLWRASCVAYRGSVTW